MEIACQTILWGRKIDDFEQVIREIAAEGFTGVEIAQRPSCLGGISSASDLKALLDHYNMSLFGLAGGTLEERITFAEGTFEGSYLYMERLEQKDEFQIHRAAKAKLLLALHPHLFKTVQTLAEARDLLNQHKELKALRFLPDIAHLTIVGDKLDTIFNYVARQSIAAIHLKDWSPEYGRSSHRYARGFVQLGHGIVHPDRFIKYLEKENYNDKLVFEQDTSRSDPAECLRRNAEWLRAHLSLPKRQIPTERYRTLNEVACTTVSFEDAQLNRFYSFLVKSSIMRTDSFFRKVTKEILILTGCRYASIWACAPAKDFLSLIAISPNPPDEVRFDKTPNFTNALSQDTIDGQKVMAFDLNNVDVIKRSSNNTFFLAAGLTGMLSIPVANSSNSNHIRYVINLFYDVPFLKPADEELLGIADYVALLVDKVLDDVASEAAGKVDLIDVEPYTLETYLEELGKQISTTFDCEGMSIFLVDEHRERLMPALTRGLKWRLGEEEFYRKGEGLTGGIWSRNQFLLTLNASREAGYKGKSRETVLSPERDECLLAPISKRHYEVLGVVRCVNRFRRADCIGATMFSDDDAAILEAMLQAASPRIELLLKHKELVGTISRLSNRLITPLNRVKTDCRLNSLGTASEALELIDGYVSNVTYHAQACFRRLEPCFSNVSLYHDVIRNAVDRCKYLQIMCHVENRYHLPIASNERVYVDRAMFRQLFFNLISNAIMFRRDGMDPEISVEIARIDEGGLVVTVQDRGIGIPADMQHLIFSEGFRCESGGHRAEGQGIGLMVCLHIAKAHECELRFRQISPFTEFQVILPHWRVLRDK